MDMENVRRVATYFISNPESATIILNDDKGLIAGLISPMLFSSKNTATEVGFWVDVDSRGKDIGIELLQAWEDWAKSLACKYSILTSVDPVVNKFYEKNGYTLKEYTYIKDLS
jgi:GNAT superfamily N-acetyltransferase